MTDPDMFDPGQPPSDPVAKQEMKIDIVSSMSEARAHLDDWPCPSGREFDDLIKGPTAPDGPTRCLWPASYKAMKERLLKMSPRQRDRHLWALYHFREGPRTPYRWMFWRCPPNTLACKGVEAVEHRGAPAKRDWTHYDDGTPTDSPEGLARSVRNSREIRRRVGNMSFAKALWRSKQERKLDDLEKKVDSGRYPAAVVSSMLKKRDQILMELQAAAPKQSEWDWGQARPIAAATGSSPF